MTLKHVTITITNAANDAIEKIKPKVDENMAIKLSACGILLSPFFIFLTIIIVLIPYCVNVRVGFC